ncbi:hypothetical protein HPB52_023053 [Rhipicephalus sanguineus]|uniref:Gustatory receptor n=1 Tax=Rhipicephalus sanguineus TaxID=34632 RepID=A0A9D4PIG4_RHISA|nr:hypothetical protein HPB52_023053 [Rhipicephalus sanguineus]
MTMSTSGFGNNYYLDLLRVVTILGNFPFFFYDMLHSFTLRPCCEVLIAYVRHQHATVRAVLPTEDRAMASPLGMAGVAELQRVKANLRSIAKLRELVNDIWQYSLAVSSAAVLIVGCITVYCTFDSGMPMNQILLSLSYFVYSALDFIDVARLSHAMADEVAHLYVSIRPKDMSLSGGNFFTLDLPLLVSTRSQRKAVLYEGSSDLVHAAIDMASAMARKFRVYGWLSRAAGVFFLRNIQAADAEEMEVKWKSWYTLYSVAFLSSLGGLYCDFVANGLKEMSKKTRTFTKALFVVVPLSAASKVMVNVFSAIFWSGKMKEFFKRASQHEMETLFWRQRYHYRSLISYTLRFFMAAACTAAVSATAHITMSTEAFGNNHFRDLLNVATILGNVVLIFYDILHSITLKPCCEVLIAYVRHQHTTVRAVLPTDDHASATSLGITGVAELQRVKANLRNIGKLRQLLNDVWQYSLAVSSATVLVVGCITVCCTFDSGMPLNQVLLSLSYFVYSALDFIDMARLSHAMTDEVANLYISIRPEDMSLSGGNFFTLDLPLLVSSQRRAILCKSAEDLVHVVINMASAMAKNFRIYVWLCRVAGVFFIKNVQAAHVEEMKVTWKSWYTLYSVAFLSFFGGIFIDFAVNAVRELSTKTRTFTKALYFIMPLAASSKVVANVCSAIFGSRKMKEFFKRASHYEMETSFWRQRYRYRSWISYALRFLTTAACSADVVVTIHITMSTAAFGSNHLLDFLKVTKILGNFVFFFYDMLHSITLRPCCEVLIAYVRHQHAIVRAVLPPDDRAIMSPLGTAGVAELQRVKANLRTIGKLRQLLNDVWQYSLAVSSAAVLVVGCITVCCTFDRGMPPNQMLLGLCYLVYSSLDFIHMAHLSHAMADEVSHLYVSLRPEDMSLSGGNFFTLDLPLLVSVSHSSEYAS